MAEKEIEERFDLSEMLGILLRRKFLFLFTFIGFFTVVFVAGLVFPKTYEASSFIRIKSKNIVDPLMKDLAVSSDLKEEVDTLAKQMMVWPRLVQMVNELHLANRLSPLEKEEYIAKLQSRISVTLTGKDLLRIVYRDCDPFVAQQVVNNLTKKFIDDNARLRREEARNAIEFIGDQLVVYRRKLEDSQQDFSTNKVDSQLRLALNRKQILEGKIADFQKTAPYRAANEQSPVGARLSQLESELTRLMMDAQEGNPRVEILKNEIAKLREKVNGDANLKAVKDNASLLNPLYLQAEQELRQIDMEIDYLTRRKQSLEMKGARATKEISEDELANLERNKKVDEDIYQMLLRQLEAAGVSERLQDSEKGNRFIVLEYARLPIEPASPKPGRVALGGLLGGLVLGLGAVFFAEHTGKPFQSVQQSREILDLPCVGSVSRIVLMTEQRTGLFASLNAYFEKHPLFSQMRFVPAHVARPAENSRLSPSLVIYHEPKCRVSEEFRIIRANLYSEADRAPKVLAITSTLRAEGKSTTAANLAVAAADSGLNVLLIDGDLRKGRVHDIFSMRATPGLTNVLMSETPLQDCIMQTPVKNLRVLCGGTRPARPSELLGSEKMRTTLAACARQFDHIIIDCPPILNLPDVCTLARVVNGVLFVIRAGHTEYKDVRAAQAVLSQARAEVLGFALTNVQYYMPRYYYDSYYAYDS